MKNLRFKKLWIALLLLWLTLTLLLCLIPLPQSDGPQYFLPLDKIFHFTTYLWLGNWCVQIFRKQLDTKIFISLLIFGLVIEILQSFTSYRSFEFADIICNASGLMAALGVRALSWDGIFRALESKIS